MLKSEQQERNPETCTNLKKAPPYGRGLIYLLWKPRRIRVGKPASLSIYWAEQQQWPENHNKLWMLDCVKRRHLYFIIFNYELWLEFFAIFFLYKNEEMNKPTKYLNQSNEWRKNQFFFLTHCHKSLSEMFSIITKSSVCSALQLLLKVLTATFNTFSFFLFLILIIWYHLTIYRGLFEHLSKKWENCTQGMWEDDKKDRQSAFPGRWEDTIFCISGTT